MVDAPLTDGKAWSDSIAIYTLPDTIYAGTYRISSQVYETRTLTVPAGSFFAYGIGGTYPSGSPVLAGYSLMGAAADERDAMQPAVWYSDGIGQVQYHTDDLYQLALYVPTSVQGTTWGRIKSYSMVRE
jgi:hypothetical protein